jgi:hypothetical protein
VDKSNPTHGAHGARVLLQPELPGEQHPGQRVVRWGWLRRAGGCQIGYVFHAGLAVIRNYMAIRPTRVVTSLPRGCQIGDRLHGAYTGCHQLDVFFTAKITSCEKWCQPLPRDETVRLWDVHSVGLCALNQVDP